MSSLSVKNLKNYVVLGIAVAAAYIFFQKDQIFLYRLIDGLFIGGMLPMILGCFRLAKYAGSFDLLVYSHKKLARSGKNSDPILTILPRKNRLPPTRSRFWPEVSLSLPPCF